MLNFLTKKYHYFIVCKADTTSKENLVEPKIYKFVKRYFFWRGRKVKYFEPFTSRETQETFAVFGTAKGEKTVNRNCLILILELYAALTSPNQFKTSDEFKSFSQRVGEQTITIYKVAK